MKKNELFELKNKKISELAKIIAQKEKQLTEERIRRHLGKIKNVHLVKRMRRDLAQIKTIFKLMMIKEQAVRDKKGNQNATS